MPVPIITAAYRTPFGEAGDVFGNVRNEDLSVTLIDHILDEHGVDSDDVGDLMWDVAQWRAGQDNNVARVIAFLSAPDEGVPAMSVNRWCASSIQAIASASDAIAASNRECIVAGGVESISHVPMDGDSCEYLHPKLSEQYNIFQLQMGMTAGKVAGEYEISRKAQDEFAFRNHQHTAEATGSGRFDDEIVPIKTADGVVTEDGGIRRDTSMEILGDLDPAFSGDDSITAGNSSQITDGVATVLVIGREFAEDHDLDVLTSVGTNNVADVDPTVMGIGPVPTTHGLLDRAGTDIDDYGLVGISEASTSQREYSRRELGINADSLNVSSDATALGHPPGASGARPPVTLIHEMQKRDVDHGLASLCIGFGRGTAIELSR